MFSCRSEMQSHFGFIGWRGSWGQIITCFDKSRCQAARITNGLVMTMTDCSVTLYNNNDYISCSFTPKRDGALYAYGTDTKIADCVANTTITVFSSINAPSITNLAYIFVWTLSLTNSDWCVACSWNNGVSSLHINKHSWWEWPATCENNISTHPTSLDVLFDIGWEVSGPPECIAEQFTFHSDWCTCGVFVIVIAIVWRIITTYSRAIIELPPWFTRRPITLYHKCIEYDLLQQTDTKFYTRSYTELWKNIHSLSQQCTPMM